MGKKYNRTSISLNGLGAEIAGILSKKVNMSKTVNRLLVRAALRNDFAEVLMEDLEHKELESLLEEIDNLIPKSLFYKHRYPASSEPRPASPQSAVREETIAPEDNGPTIVGFDS